MKIKVALFASARESAGTDQVEVNLEESATVKQLKQALVTAHPELESLISRSVFSVDQEYASDDRVLESRAEVALIPPVSGG